MYASNQEFDYLFKLVIIGDSGVGKSSLLYRYCDDAYTEWYVSTVGVDFKIKTINVKDKVVKLQIWDTAGQERFRTITSTYYKNAHVVMIVFDITDEESFTHIPVWLEDLRKGLRISDNDNLPPIILIGNKKDLELKRVIKYEDASEFAKINRMTYIETSAKNDIAVGDAFVAIVTKAMEKEQTNMGIGNIKPKPSINIGIDQKIHRKCC